MSILWSRIIEVVLRSLFAVADAIPTSPSSFELFGYDLLIDEALRPWLIEVSHAAHSPTKPNQTLHYTRPPALLCTAFQYNTIDCRTVQPNAPHCAREQSKAWDATPRPRPAWHRTAPHRKPRHATTLHATVLHAALRYGTTRHGTARCGTALAGGSHHLTLVTIAARSMHPRALPAKTRSTAQSRRLSSRTRSAWCPPRTSTAPCGTRWCAGESQSEWASETATPPRRPSWRSSARYCTAMPLKHHASRSPRSKARVPGGKIYFGCEALV